MHQYYHFTTEEITDLSNKNKKISIHEETFSELPENWQNQTLYKKWEKLLFSDNKLISL